jgi:hypothetical protein
VSNVKLVLTEIGYESVGLMNQAEKTDCHQVAVKMIMNLQIP